VISFEIDSVVIFEIGLHLSKLWAIIHCVVFETEYILWNLFFIAGLIHDGCFVCALLLLLPRFYKSTTISSTNSNNAFCFV